MSETLTYLYEAPSSLANDELFLSRYSEVEKTEAPCFFTGRLKDPFTVARCLVTLSNVVQASFSLTPAQLQKLRDPIVTAGNERLHFEGFSQCAGVYGCVDLLRGAYEGEFPATGTTNVDFNPPMIAALGAMGKKDNVVLSVGKSEVSIAKGDKKIVERKVSLPSKWIKGLTTVQLFLAASEKQLAFDRVRAMQLFQSIPNGKPKNDYFLVMKGNKPTFSPVYSEGSILVGGVHRLKLIEPLLNIADELRVFPHPDMQSTTWQLYFGNVRFSLSLSREAYRGFSGEGAALESLIEDIPDAWIKAVDNYAYANQAFNPTILGIEEDIGPNKMANITSRLSAMGLLGFDLDDNQFFYRRLPFKLNRILSLNPRMKDAEQLVLDGLVEIVQRTDNRVEARVQGSGVTHHVLIADGRERCTCLWYSQNQGERGVCKHILAVKKMIAQ